MATYWPPGFSYDTLKPGEVRFLVLDPGSISAPLRCGLIHRPIGSGILSIEPWQSSWDGYEALSYTWGSPAKPCRIEVYSADSYGPETSIMNITANLDAALRQLRYSDRQRLLWIDAICINQEDAKEREEQVLLMKTIFSEAQQTVVWLGEDDETTVDAITCIELMRVNYTKLPNNGQQDLRRDLELVNFRPWLLDRSHRGYISASVWHAFKQLLSRPWFSRVWVFQEVTISLAVTIMCGKAIISWPDLCEACKVIEVFNLDISYREHQPLHTSILIMQEAQSSHSRLRINVPDGAAAPRRNIYRLKRPNLKAPRFEGTVYPRLDIMLLMLRWAKASDPRDKVYALLGISSGFSTKRLMPDYTVSLQAAYIHTAKIVSGMKDLSALAFLSFVQHDDRFLSTDLPSWVPDWRKELHAPWIIYNSGFRTASSKVAQIKFPVSKISNTLIVRGVSIMKVAILSSHAGKNRRMPPQELLCRFPNPYSCSQDQAYVEGLDPHTNFLGSVAPSNSSACQSPFWKWHQQWRDHCPDLADADGLQRAAGRGFAMLGLPWPVADPDIAAWDRLDKINGIAHGRRLFVTELGFLGLAPLASMVGDEVCILFGGKVPYVIRRIGLQYRFVGECYVFGIMNGEVLEGISESHCEDFEFFY